MLRCRTLRPLKVERPAICTRSFTERPAAKLLRNGFKSQDLRLATVYRCKSRRIRLAAAKRPQVRKKKWKFPGILFVTLWHAAARAHMQDLGPTIRIRALQTHTCTKRHFIVPIVSKYIEMQFIFEDSLKSENKHELNTGLSGPLHRVDQRRQGLKPLRRRAPR